MLAALQLLCGVAAVLSWVLLRRAARQAEARAAEADRRADEWVATLREVCQGVTRLWSIVESHLPPAAHSEAVAELQTIVSALESRMVP